jgi:hypothetical protein
MPQAAVSEIHWFVTAYVIAEDRLRFACTLKSGDTDVFWLTQRLANAVTKNLLDWLDKTVQEDGFPELAHRVAQRSATSKRPKPPQTSIPDAPGWLVNSVNIRSVGKGLILTFKDGAERSVVLRFDAQNLRRWLKVLHAQYRRSGWPMDLWPDWIADAAAITPNVQSGLLH